MGYIKGTPAGPNGFDIPDGPIPHQSVVDVLKGIFHRKEKQSTFIYCEKCGNELCSSGSFVSDTYDENCENHVLYKCSKCGHECDYNFDIAPIPIKWSELANGGVE